MPVRELTERPTIPRLGKIRLGEMLEEPDPRHPTRTRRRLVNRPYFVVPEEIKAVYGAEPTELRIVFLADDEDVIASQYYRAYNATNGLICKGDGYRADALLDEDELEKSGGELTIDVWAHGESQGRPATEHLTRRQISCAGQGYEGQPPCPMYAAKRCAVRMFLQFAVYGVPGIGVYQLDTGSIHGIKTINGLLTIIRSLTGGKVSGVPLLLRREQIDVAPEGKRKKVWTVTLAADTKMDLPTLIEHSRATPAAALLPPVDESEVYDNVPDDDDDDQPEPADANPVTPSAGTTTEIQRIAIADWREAINGRYPTIEANRLLTEVAAWGAKEFPYATSASGRLSTLALKEADADRFILRLRWYAEGQKQHQHEVAYMPDGETLICRMCGEGMQEQVLATAPE